MKRVHLLLLMMGALALSVPAQAKSVSDLKKAGYTCGEIGIPGLSITRCEKCAKNVVTGKSTCKSVNCDKSGKNCKAVTIFVPNNLQEEADLGYSLAGVGDVNDDTVPDIAVGDSAHSQAFVFSGVDGTLLYTLNAPDPQEETDFGHSLAGVGDVDGDAVPDIAVGTPSQGRAFVFSGADGTFLYTSKLTAPGVMAQIPGSFTYHKVCATVVEECGSVPEGEEPIECPVVQCWWERVFHPRTY